MKMCREKMRSCTIQVLHFRLLKIIMCYLVYFDPWQFKICRWVHPICHVGRLKILQTNLVHCNWPKSKISRYGPPSMPYWYVQITHFGPPESIFCHVESKTLNLRSLKILWTNLIHYDKSKSKISNFKRGGKYLDSKLKYLNPK